MTIASFSFLLCITRRDQVAQIFGKPIYVIKDVAILPLSSQAEADQAINQTQAGLQKAKGSHESDEASSTSGEDGYESFGDHSVADPSESQTPAEKPQIGGRSESTTSVVQDVIERKGQYGRFASQWFSRRGWGLGSKPTEETSTQAVPTTNREDQELALEAVGTTAEGGDSPIVSKASHHHDVKAMPVQHSIEGAAVEMLPKILRTAKLLFTSQSFYFSYEFDISRRLGSSSIALLKSVSPDGFEQQVRRSYSGSQVLPLTIYSFSGTNS